MTTGEKIAALRKSQNLSYKNFADRIGCSATHVGKLEKDFYQVRDESLASICKAFELNPLYFTGDMTLEEALPKKKTDGLSVGERLKKLREEKHLTQIDLASLSGATQPVISNIESGREKMNLKQARKLAAALEVGEEYLLTGNLEKKNDPVNEELIEWLWNHPKKRAELWKEMKK